MAAIAPISRREEYFGKLSKIRRETCAKVYIRWIGPMWCGAGTVPDGEGILAWDRGRSRLIMRRLIGGFPVGDPVIFTLGERARWHPRGTKPKDALPQHVYPYSTYWK